jgi:hypothetical protein
MRVTISLLATTFVLGSFAINNQDQAYNMESTVLLSAKPKPSKQINKPTKPTSHRGSGRRELV